MCFGKQQVTPWGWKVQASQGRGAGQIRPSSSTTGKLSHIFYPDVAEPARVQEESFPKLIFIIQKFSVSAPQLILTTVPDLPSPLLLIESLTSKTPPPALLATPAHDRRLSPSRLGWGGHGERGSDQLCCVCRLWLLTWHFFRGPER